MLSRLFYMFLNAFGVFFRTLRAFCSRQVNKVVTAFKRATNFSRKAARAVPDAISSVAVAGKKPTRREDFVETRRLFISKSFIAIAIIALVGFGILFYFLIWPWILSTFLTAHMPQSDARVPSYSGKVVLYYDSEKQKPKFEGRLVEGLAEGAGKEYDENSLQLFTGDYLGGLHHGKGMLYEDGVLVYDGDFEYGVIHGEGIQYDAEGMKYAGDFANGEYSGFGTLYDGGIMRYRGNFAFGKFNGEGTLFDPSGVAVYKGGFTEGEKNGQGLQYYLNGTIEYKGSFLEGKFEDRGLLYNEDGSLKYDGGFSKGLYQGEGTAFLGDDVSVEGKFEAGKPMGDVSIYKEGRLRYTGAVLDLVPHGYGTIYATGSEIYRGMMRYGVPDGSSFIGLSPDDARARFAAASVTESRDGNNGFSVVNTQLGMSLYFSLRTESSDPAVLRAYLYPSEAIAELPWKTNADYEIWAVEQELPLPVDSRLSYDSIVGDTPFSTGRYYRATYYYENETVSMWSQSEGEEIFMLEWTSVVGSGGTDGGAGGGGNESAGGAASGDEGGAPLSAGGRTEELLQKLGMEDSGGTAEPDPSKYYGTGNPTELLTGLSAADVDAVLNACADYLENAERREAFEQQLAIRERQLTAANELLATGDGDEKLVENLLSEISALNLRISKCVIGMEKARMSVMDKSGQALEVFDITQAMFVADPAEFDLDSLRGASLGSTDALNVNLEILDIELAYQEMLDAIDTYNGLREGIGGVYSDYEMGKASQEELDESVIACLEARGALYSNLSGYSRNMLRLNAMSGNWLALRCGFMGEIFSALPYELPEDLTETSGETAGETSGETPDETSGETSDETSDETPGGSSGETPGGNSDETPGGASDETSGGAPDESSAETPDETEKDPETSDTGGDPSEASTGGTDTPETSPEITPPLTEDSEVNTP